MKEQLRFVATSPLLLETINVQCDRAHEHETLQRSNTAVSASYTQQSCGCNLCLLLALLAYEDYGSCTCTTCTANRTVYYVDVTTGRRPSGDPFSYMPRTFSGARNTLASPFLRSGSSTWARFSWCPGRWHPFKWLISLKPSAYEPA